MVCSDQLLLNRSSIEVPAISPGSRALLCNMLYKSISDGQKEGGGEGESAPHTGDVLTTDLGKIGPSHGNSLRSALGIRNTPSRSVVRTIFPII